MLKLRQYLQEKVLDANDQPEDLTRLTVDELKRLNQLTKAYEADTVRQKECSHDREAPKRFQAIGHNVNNVVTHALFVARRVPLR